MHPNFNLLAILAASAVPALASPRKPTLAHRAPQPITPEFKLDPNSAVHFLDCEPRSEAVLAARQSGAPEPSWLSILVYCANATDCLDPSHVPVANDVCVKQTSTTPRDWNHWENQGDFQHCRFAERGWFSWVIAHFGRIFAPGDDCGYAEDNDESPWDGFRGEENQGPGPETHVCSRIYYFFPAAEVPASKE